MNRRHTIMALIAMSAAARPPGSLAQQPGKVWRIGYLSLGPASGRSRNIDAFLKGMRELGYAEGRNLVIEWRLADGKFERLPGMAAELVRLKVDLIVAVASAAIAAAQKATNTIPIVMATTGDPLGSGFVKSLARPGGNITGLSNMGGETGAKDLELLLSVVPRLAVVGLLVTPTSPTYRAISDSVRAGAQRAGVKILVAEASTPQEIENAFSMMSKENVGAVLVGASPFFALQQSLIADLAIKHRLPSMFGNRAYVDAGGLMSYGQNIADNFLRAATYVHKILNGANPGDLPVEQPLTLEFVINVKTAKAIGLAVPPPVLARADDLVQ